MLFHKNLLLLTILSLTTSSLLAVDQFEKIKPQEVPQEEKTPTISEQNPEDLLDFDVQVQGAFIDNLKSIVFINDESDVIKDQSELSSKSGVQSKNVKILQDHPDFLKKLNDQFIGKEVSMDTVLQLQKEMILFYKNENLFVVHIYAPDQEVTSGVLQLVVKEGKVDKVRVEGNKYSSSESIARKFNLKKGDPINAQQLNTKLEKVNAYPFRRVNLELTPGKENWSTDVVLMTKDRFPLRAYAGIDDSGVESTGDHRWFVGGNWGNPLGQDDILSYQYTASLENMDFLTAHAASYSLPLPWYDNSLLVYGSYSETNPALGVPGIEYNLETWQSSFRYQIPIVIPDTNIKQGFEAGIDYKETNAAFALGGTVLPVNATSVFQIVGKYSASYNDPYGRTDFSIENFYSPGDVVGRNKLSDYQAVDRRLDNEYVYGKIALERNQKLPYDLSLNVKGMYQWADGRLLSSEQLGLGGYNSVRGYEEYEATGDEGFLVRTELRSPAFDLFRGDLILLGFYDYGQTQNTELLINEDPHVLLHSLGVGFRYNIASNFSARFDWGWQLDDTGLAQRGDSRAHFALVVGF
jgi:hemolysin activation/secretion protein